MTRFGWILLGLFLIVAVGLASMVRFREAAPIRPVTPSAPAPDPARVPVVAEAAPSSPAGSLAIPVAGVSASALVDSFDEPRGGGTRSHHAIDILAPEGTPVLAAAAGRVEKLFDSEAGGLMIYVRAAPDVVHYYGHLAGYAPGLVEGQQVSIGTALGFVGATGDADPGAPHLHFGVKRLMPEEGWWQGVDVDPYPLLAGKAADR